MLSKDSPDAMRALYEQINVLESSLSDIKVKQLQERYYCGIVIVLLLDVLLLSPDNLMLTGFICSVEAIAFLALAEACGIEQVAEWTKRFMALASKHLDAQIAKYNNGKPEK